MAVLSTGENIWVVKAVRENTDEWPRTKLPGQDDIHRPFYVEPRWVKIVLNRPEEGAGWSVMYLEAHGRKTRQTSTGGWTRSDHGHGVARLDVRTLYRHDALLTLAATAVDVANRSWRSQVTRTRRAG